MSKKDISILSKNCQVCDRNAVGFHYGAYVCEACKKFFIRHATGICKLYGSCPDKGKCNLKIDGRGKCQHCRYQRCIDIGMNIDSKSSDYDLTSIPCQVCNAKSSGLHFGCITCEGCKGFFRRMIKFKGILICFNDNKCKLNVKNRSTCKSCRMSRCLEVGMSRKGIRIGRHTNSLKFNCINLLKRGKPLNGKLESIHTNIKEQTKSVNLEQNDSNLSKVVSTANCDNLFKNLKSHSNKIMDDVQSSDNKISVSYTQDNCHFKTISLDCSSRKTKSEIKEKYNEVFENSIKDAEIYLSVALEFFTNDKTNLPFSDKTSNLLSLEDDIQIVWSIMMDHFISHSQFVVKFAKLMPGFNNLSLLDKKVIIKDSLYAMILLELSQDYNNKSSELCFNYFDFSVEDHMVILNIFPEFVEFSFQVKKVKSIKCTLDLSGFELILLCGIMMFHNFENLQNWLYGKFMMRFYQNRLRKYIRSNHQSTDSDIGIREEKCFELISILDEMNLDHQRIIVNFLSNHIELQYPDLYIEVFKQ